MNKAAAPSFCPNYWSSDFFRAVLSRFISRISKWMFSRQPSKNLLQQGIETKLDRYRAIGFLARQVIIAYLILSRVQWVTTMNNSSFERVNVVDKILFIRGLRIDYHVRLPACEPGYTSSFTFQYAPSLPLCISSFWMLDGTVRSAEIKFLVVASASLKTGPLALFTDTLGSHGAGYGALSGSHSAGSIIFDFHCIGYFRNRVSFVLLAYFTSLAGSITEYVTYSVPFGGIRSGNRKYRAWCPFRRGIIGMFTALHVPCCIFQKKTCWRSQ